VDGLTETETEAEKYFTTKITLVPVLHANPVRTVHLVQTDEDGPKT